MKLCRDCLGTPDRLLGGTHDQLYYVPQLRERKPQSEMPWERQTISPYGHPGLSFSNPHFACHYR